MTHAWALEDIAREFRYKDTIARRLVAQPDFPKPIRLFNGAHRRWIAREVIEYFEAKKEAA